MPSAKFEHERVREPIAPRMLPLPRVCPHLTLLRPVLVARSIDASQGGASACRTGFATQGLHYDLCGCYTTPSYTNTVFGSGCGAFEQSRMLCEARPGAARLRAWPSSRIRQLKGAAEGPDVSWRNHTDQSNAAR